MSAFCCHPGCEAPATWEIWDGEQPYHANYTQACTEHVGALLTDAPEHRVSRLDPATGQPAQS